MSWYESLAFAADATTIPVIPIGTFDTSKYGKVPLLAAKAQRILANFQKRVLKTDVMVDVDHDMSRSAGWVRELRMGTFPHAVTGAPIQGLLADVEWTPYGENLVMGKEYRYLSATLGTYHDEESGEDIPDVLYTVSLTNSPVMKLMPSIALSEAVEFAFSDTTFTDTEEAPLPVEETAVEVAAEPVPADPPKGGSHMAEEPTIVTDEEPDLTENDGSLVLAETILTERDAARKEADELRAELKRERVTRRLDALSDKGLTEPARNMLEAILLSDGEAICLSEGAEPVDITDAILTFADAVEFVPVETTIVEAPVDETPTITPERAAIKAQLRT